MNTKQLKKIHVISAVPGDGKTFQMVKHLAKKSLDDRTYNAIYVVPTVELGKQVRDSFRSYNLTNIHFIYATNGSTLSVKQQINKLTAGSTNDGKIIIITQAAFLFDLHIHDKERYELFFDEIIPADDKKEYKVPQNYEKILKWVQPCAVQTAPSELLQLELKDIEYTKAFIKQPDDTLSVPLVELLQLFFEPTNVYVLAEHWNELKNGDKKRLLLMSIYTPELFSGYRSVTMAGDNVESSILIEYFKTYFNVKVEPHKEICTYLRNGLGLTNKNGIITYLSDMDSTKYMKKLETDGIQNLTLLDKLALKALNLNESFLFVTNKYDTNSVVVKQEHCIKIPVESQGMNAYQHVDQIFVKCSLNKEPDHCRIIEHLLGQEFVKSHSVDKIFQLVMRTSLRNIESFAPVNIVVVDKQTAKMLQKRLGNQFTVSRIDGAIEQKQRINAVDPVEQRQNHNFKQKIRDAHKAIAHYEAQYVLKPTDKLLKNIEKNKIKLEQLLQLGE